MRWLVIVGLVFLFGKNAPAYATENNCANDKRVIGECYDVHGRLRVYMNLRPYLWPIGTKRLLGIAYQSNAQNGDLMLPANVTKVLNPGTEVFGDFRVCPFTLDEPDKMRIVCVDSASHIVSVLRNDRQGQKN